MSEEEYKESCARLGIPYREHEYHEKVSDYIKRVFQLDPDKMEKKETQAGVKYDDKKAQWSLVPPDAMEDIVDVLTYGANKYSPDNWKRVENADTRYFNAAMRHLWAWRQGEQYDSESHKSHLAHAACCLMFLMAFDNEADKDDSPF